MFLFIGRKESYAKSASQYAKNGSSKEAFHNGDSEKGKQHNAR